MDSYYMFFYGQPDQNGCVAVMLYECLYNYVATIKTKIKYDATFLKLDKIRQFFLKERKKKKGKISV